MNKERLLQSFNKMGKESINKYDFYTFIGSLVLGSIACDLNLNYLKVVAGSLFLMEIMWLIFSTLSFVITEIIIRKKNKVGNNIEKLIDEESRKE